MPVKELDLSPTAKVYAVSVLSHTTPANEVFVKRMCRLESDIIAELKRLQSELDKVTAERDGLLVTVYMFRESHTL